MIYKNMPSANMRWVLFVRWWLDILAALHLLLQRKPKNALNILKAQWIFLKLRKDFRADRTKNLALSKVDYPIGFFKNSILIEYYLKSHKTAQSLFSKKTSYR